VQVSNGTISALLVRRGAQVVVAPTGFGSQASLFEITFEGLAGAAFSTVRMREMAAGLE
jgi:hypothetical protein